MVHSPSDGMECRRQTHRKAASREWDRTQAHPTLYYDLMKTATEIQRDFSPG